MSSRRRVGDLHVSEFNYSLLAKYRNVLLFSFQSTVHRGEGKLDAKPNN